MNKQELARRIVRDMGYEYQTVRNIIDGIAFEGWFHDPNQVPGRTITAGEVGRHSHLIRSIPIAGQVETPSIIDFLEAIGITVVPDPEPTNAEKLEIALKTHFGPGVFTVEGGSLSRFLDGIGVTAPEANDDQ